MTTHIAVQGLRKEFGSFVAVDNLSFTIGAGEVLGFLGPNGAGKSTTMKMITGFLPPTAGRVDVCGVDVVAKPVAAKARLGYLPEGAPLYPEMTPAGFLSFIADVRRLRGEQKNRRLAEVAEQVQLKEVWRQPIDTLSKGFKRRVGLAQAILHDPEVLILDEPTDGLDPNQKQEVRQLVQTMAETKAIIISTHILEEVDAVCSRALIIARGQVVADGTPNELTARSPRHGAVTLVTTAPEAEQIAAALQHLGGVDRVETASAEKGQIRLTAIPTHGAALLEGISGLLQRHEWPVSQLVQEQGRLDEVFRALTTEAPATQGGQA
jgi:ABC-2 type transport system ATP-binding protein